MTKFDDRLYRVLETLAGDEDTVQISGRQLADLLDVSAKTIRDSQKRLIARGLITVIPTDDIRTPSLTTLTRTRGGLTRVLDYPQPWRQGGESKTHPYAAPTGSANDGEPPEPESTPEVGHYWLDELKAQVADIDRTRARHPANPPNLTDNGRT